MQLDSLKRNMAQYEPSCDRHQHEIDQHECPLCILPGKPGKRSEQEQHGWSIRWSYLQCGLCDRILVYRNAIQIVDWQIRLLLGEKRLIGVASLEDEMTCIPELMKVGCPRGVPRFDEYVEN